MRLRAIPVYSFDRPIEGQASQAALVDIDEILTIIPGRAKTIGNSTFPESFELLWEPSSQDFTNGFSPAVCFRFKGGASQVFCAKAEEVVQILW